MVEIIISCVALLFSLIALAFSIGYRARAEYVASQVNELDRVVHKDIEPVLQSCEIDINDIEADVIEMAADIARYIANQEPKKRGRKKSE